MIDFVFFNGLLPTWNIFGKATIFRYKSLYSISTEKYLTYHILRDIAVFTYILRDIAVSLYFWLLLPLASEEG